MVEQLKRERVEELAKYPGLDHSISDAIR
jgi:hypothetical protein